MSMATTYPTRNTGRVPNLTSRRIANPARQPGGTLAPTRNSAEPFVNVGDAERLLSAVGGGALALYGLSRGTLGGLCAAALGGAFVYRGLTGHCDCYAALGVRTTEGRGPMTSVPAGHGVKVEQTVTINRPAEDLYRYWRNFENLPRFMSHLESVKENGNRSHWMAKAPLGMTVEWDAEVYNDRRGELIAWRSIEGSTVDTAGSVHFTRAPGGRGTEVRVVLKYDPPAGKVGAALARWLGEAPEQQIAEDLNAFKRLMEAGESAATRGQPAAR
jgi:uncharacterized membrane protein